MCTAAYKLTPDFFREPLVAISDTEFGLPQMLAHLAESKRVAVVLESAWQSVGCPEDMAAGAAFVQDHYSEKKEDI